MTGVLPEFDGANGLPPRHIDPITERLSASAKAFEDAQMVREASQLRGDEMAAELFKRSEDALSRRLGQELREHVLWPWLSELKGLAGPLTARVIATIGDPRRFPGQQCSMGHTLPPLFQEGEACPITATEIAPENDWPNGGGEVSSQADSHGEIEREDGLAGLSDTETRNEREYVGGVGDSHTADDEEVANEDAGVRCVGVMLPPRPGTGVRSLWHYFGVHVVDGKLPQRRKGQQADWNPTGRTLLLQPKGIADQIIIHRPEPYRTTYDEARERGKYHSVARIIAAKQFLGDLLIIWKEAV